VLTSQFAAVGGGGHWRLGGWFGRGLSSDQCAQSRYLSLVVRQGSLWVSAGILAVIRWIQRAPNGSLTVAAFLAAADALTDRAPATLGEAVER
jgi:hypothetical protein